MSAIRVSELEGYRRVDAEYYQPHYLDLVERLDRFKSLVDYSPIILHPAEVTRVYDKVGLQLLFTQNIRANYLDFSHVRFLPIDVEPLIRRNRLELGDVVVTRTGANYGDAASYDGTPSPLYASAHCIIIRCKSIPGAYLSTYFNTEIGRALLRRGVYGAAQPEIAPNYIHTLRIPRDIQTEEFVQYKINQAKQKRGESELLYNQAQSLLAAELGLDHLDLSESLYSVRRASEVWQARRIDAEHYRTKYYRVMDALSNLNLVKIVPLEELVTMLTNGHTPLHHDLDTGDTPFLTAEHVYDFRLDYDNARRIWAEHHANELKRTSLRENDILVTIKGRVGNAAVVEHLPGPTNINQDVALIRLKPGYHPYYIVGYLNSPVGKALMEQVSTGQINPFLGLGNLAQVRMPIFEQDLMDKIGREIQLKIDQAYRAHYEAKRLLADAKAAVEEMIKNIG